MNGSGGYSNWVIKIIIANVAIYLLQMFLARSGDWTVMYHIGGQNIEMQGMTFYFGLIPAMVLQEGYVFQFLTYMFLHGSTIHILFNMYALFLFGMPVEQVWGSKKFLIYFFLTGIGAGITIFLLNLILRGSGFVIPTIGASGAVFGVLLAFGVLFPNATILLFFFIPIRAKYLVILYGGIEFFLLISSGGQSGISHIGHLGGLLFGLIFFLFDRRRMLSLRRMRFKSQNRQSSPSKENTSEDETTFLRRMLKTIKEKGPDALDDDSYQRLRYMIIMHGDEEGLCVPEDFSDEDEYCDQCEKKVLCYLRAIKKYL